MELFISILTFLKSIFPEKTILVFSSKETFRRGEYDWILENKTNISVEIINIKINGVELNSISGILEHKDLPLKISPLSKLTWKFYMTKDNHYLKPHNVKIIYKSFWIKWNLLINL